MGRLTANSVARRKSDIFFGGIVLLSLILLIRGALNPKIFVTWEMENELDITGFNLYRAESEDGEYARINPALIPPSADPLIGGEFVYADDDVNWFETYYYQLELLYRLGTSERTDPIPLRAKLRLNYP